MLLREEKWLSKDSLQALEALMNDFVKRDILDLQEGYVALFDRTPSLSLHLFEHVYGDSRERGQALVDLTRVYEEGGLVIKTGETPDYLPLFLEYISGLSTEEAQENLGSVVNILSSLGERLKNRTTHYEAVFTALVEVASKKPDPKAIKKALSEDTGIARSPEQMDQEWEEQFAFENTAQTTGAGQDGGCPKAGEMLARIRDYNDKERGKK